MNNLIDIIYTVEYFDTDQGRWKRLAAYDDFGKAVEYITYWIGKDAERGLSFSYRVLKSVFTCEGVFNG